MKNSAKILSIISIVVLIIAIINSVQTESQDSIKPHEIEYGYTDEDLYCKQSATEVTYEVRVLKIFKEQNKEDMYLIEFGDNLDFGTTKEIEITKNEYLKHIGEGNNRVRGTQYYLEMYVENKGKQEEGANGNQHKIFATRYSFLGENDFSKEEVRQIADYTKKRCSNPYVIPLYNIENPRPLSEMCKTHIPSVDFWEKVAFKDGFKPITEFF